MRQGLVAGLVVALAFPALAPAGPQAPDPEVAKGIVQVEEGDYDAAILTLDAAARRLAQDARASRELSQAYLYLGVAYVGKGHDAAAKAKFRDAVRQLRDLTLSPDKFPPKVIDIFEAARDEVTHEPAAAPAAAPAAVKKKGGHGKTPLILGGLAVAGGGAALALKKSHDSGGCDTVFADRSGPLSLPNDAAVDVVGGPAIEAGVWFGELSWSGGAPDSDVLLTALMSNGQPITDGGLVSAGKRKVEWNGVPGATYGVRAQLVRGGPVTFELSIGGPCTN